jgi:hypothetical protein
MDTNIGWSGIYYPLFLLLGLLVMALLFAFIAACDKI